MRTLIAVTMMLTFLTALTVTASAGSYVPSDWGYWATDGTFVLDRGNVEWASVWGSNIPYPSSGMNNRIATQILGDTRWSGGEWFDIEGLYMDIVTKADSHTYLDWLLITSYPGVEPDEWTPATGWTGSQTSGAAGWFAAGAGIYAYHRDHGSPPNQPSPWAYRSNPVIALDLGGNAGGYEYALVLDSTEGCNSASQYGGTPYDITTTAALYSVTDNTAWKYWVAPDADEFPTGKIADVDTGGLTPIATGPSAKNFALDHIETAGNMTGGGATWAMPYNWYWTGSIDLTGKSIVLPGETTPTAVHYAMWCSNDLIELTGSGYTAEPTPELPSGALLLLGMLPAGFAWWRRRGR